MCGRFGLVNNIDEVAQQMEVFLPESSNFAPNYNTSPGDYSPVITNQQPDILQFFQFGLTPHWAQKRMYLFNARAEGDFNKDNDPAYQGELGITKKASFKKAIRSQRCLIPANFFIEGTTQGKLNKPYVVYLTDRAKKPFSFAGLWDTWHDRKKNVLVNSFTIITTTPNALLQQIPHHRSPVILPSPAEKQWLSNAPLEELLPLLKAYDATHMQAYPIDPAIKNPKVNGRNFVRKISDVLLKVR